jgi:uncharacterized protein (DUF2147 family)
MAKTNFLMKCLIKWMVMGLFFIVWPSIIFAAVSDSQSVLGNWQTIDGKTRKPSSVITIERENQFYIGKITKTYANNTSDKKIARCAACKGEQKDESIIGLKIIKHMICRGDYCSHGTILDPRSGQVYHATMQVIRDGQELKVRGYVGVPMFGKTVVWRRLGK